ncbi:unnamed protein product [Tuber melanosporum]|uniref:(Perigord truffle) hypothetical protein n=1 Tax=Tuber melanosporum (strain Mel28) TaxID=656061 RepID=D5GBE3_TUBMM|nr:uncharacterized protein GSTUM_00000483001 [Tuber melanosporum]CAZ81836.1 unnamed protein product [Tuber melanosporum]
MKCALLGATRGCGLETLLNLHRAGHECYILARNSTAAAETLSTQNVPANSPLLHIIQGDAFEADDIRKLFTAAGKVDFVMFSLGGRPSFTNPLSPKLVPPHICTRSMQIFLPIFTEFYPTPATQPRLVVISSNGLGPQGHADLPLALKPLYGWLLKEPHEDKEEMEREVHAAAGIRHVDFNPDGKNEGRLGNVVIVRPALLTDGVAKGEEGAVRAGERLERCWTVSRKDVGWFVAGQCLTGDQWRNKGVTVGY